MLPGTLGLACAPDAVTLLLGALVALGIADVREAARLDLDLVEATTGASLALTATGSAVSVGTELEEVVLNSWTGASTTGSGDAATTTGSATLCVTIDPREIVSIVEARDCLGLTVYRTIATPAAVPRRMVTICSKTMGDRRRRVIFWDGVKAPAQGNQKRQTAFPRL
jgi:hypothetical protein